MSEETAPTPGAGVPDTRSGDAPASADTRASDGPISADTPRRSLWMRLREKWGVGPWGLLAILLAFALAGMSVLKISRPIMHFLLPPDTPKWLWWTIRILVIVPIYEVLLLSYGTILGKREFFWSKQKRTLRFLSWPFRMLARPFVTLARRSRSR